MLHSYILYICMIQDEIYIYIYKEFSPLFAHNAGHIRLCGIFAKLSLNFIQTQSNQQMRLSWFYFHLTQQPTHTELKQTKIQVSLIGIISMPPTHACRSSSYWLIQDHRRTTLGLLYDRSKTFNSIMKRSEMKISNTDSFKTILNPRQDHLKQFVDHSRYTSFFFSILLTKAILPNLMNLNPT